MRLFYMLKKIKISNDNLINHNVTKLSNKSSGIVSNSIFFAIRGENNDGNNFIEEAIKKGAKTVVTENFCWYKGINIIQVDSVEKTMALLAKVYYKKIYKKFNLIGITGTNGKTTITNILYNYLNYEGKNTMAIGTLGIMYNEKTILTKNTTEDILSIYNAFLLAIENNIETIVMEISSHAIKKLRIFGISFNNIIFTNITRDHIDFHKNETDYLYTKSRLIYSIRKNGILILNKDEKYYKLFNSMTSKKVISYSTKEYSNYRFKLKEHDNFKTRFEVNDKLYTTKFLGDFNIYNITAIISLIDNLGYDLERFNVFLQIFSHIEGRMDITYDNDRMYIVDYAHTPDAVENVLKSLRKYSPSRLTVVMGCGGNRDKEKRHIMGEICVKYSDKVIFTNDNPRSEEPLEIVRDITRTLEPNMYNVILDRKEAISSAIFNSLSKEVVAILGKGHESYQEIENKKIKFSDKKIIENVIKEEKQNE